MIATDRDGPLRTWRLDEAPAFEHMAPFTVSGQRSADHRRAYLTYEGPVSSDRGSVSAIEHGHADWMVSAAGREQVRLGTDNGQWTVSFHQSSAATNQLEIRFTPIS